LISAPKEIPVQDTIVEAEQRIATMGNGPIQPETVGVGTIKDRNQLFQEMSSLYAEMLEYPLEVFTEEIQLEAELGIDSIKQTELLARVSERYKLPPRPDSFRLSNYDTMGKVVDFAYSFLADTQQAQESLAERKELKNDRATHVMQNGSYVPEKAYTVDRNELFGQITTLYAEALEYPIEVFSDEIQLEAELGVDSIKQTELLARVRERYKLPPRSDSFRLSDYDTMGKVVDFACSMLKQSEQTVPSSQRDLAYA
jgi:acyl carrier protein